MGLSDDHQLLLCLSLGRDLLVGLMEYGWRTRFEL